ncbi:cation:proton antiporter [Stratiformator vulcanicus]|uniref:High-affinity Na(+)/H(+) antiporter NhaS3 n=1 Tax=Stratiformator vulcanicus TaxID=2527980 RepID=A0A517QZV1_9PLAN|nr:cation:proton antiporter [Stratiformator vulcanicus]QDT37172.1 High-affinity Na(+)/H(+) antiporter NhaS3 [Stratiformator vulcanicus]
MSSSTSLFGRAGSRYSSLSPIGKRKFWGFLTLLFAAVLLHDLQPGAYVFAQTESGEQVEAGSADDSDHDHHDGEHAEGEHDAAHGDSHGGAGGDDHGGGHANPVAPVLAGIVVILFFAKIGGDLCERVGMPAVLGELTVGIIIGNLDSLVGINVLHFMEPPASGAHPDGFDPGAILYILAEIGVVLLLFEVGLESTVGEMMKVGVSSAIVAILGVVAPIALGYGVGMLFFDGWEVPLFLGATLCATSVGITARVLKDIGRSQDTESQIILGAAVIDDVLGLIVLAVVSGAIAAASAAGPPPTDANATLAEGGEAASVAVIDDASEHGATSLEWQIVQIVLLAIGFLGGALLLGNLNFPGAVFNYASSLRGHGLLVTFALVICFLFAFLANYMGLATIVGAFAAGLILERVQYEELETKEAVELEEAIRPLTAIFVPIFFVEMGMQVDLMSFLDSSVWGLATLLIIAAVIGKQICSLGVREPGLNKLSVGLGMIPRGEVGLIFANEGRKLVSHGESVIDTSTYASVVVMVMVTTVVTPPLLKWSMGKAEETGDLPPDEAPPRIG